MAILKGQKQALSPINMTDLHIKSPYKADLALCPFQDDLTLSPYKIDSLCLAISIQG